MTGLSQERRTPVEPVVTRPDQRRWLLATLVAALLVLVVVLLVGGGSPQVVAVGLPDPGPATEWLLPVLRLTADGAGLAVLGLLLTAGVLVESPVTRLRPTPQRAVRLARRLAWVWAGAALVELVLTISDILGEPLDRLGLRESWSFVREIPQGRALVVQAVLAVSLALACLFVVTPARAAGLAVLAVLTLTPPALTGHSASSGNHELAVASLLVHVVSASVWVGGVAALLWMSTRVEVPPETLARFSTLAGWCYAAVGVSGVVNAGVRLGGLDPLVSTTYGALVLAKVTALLVLGGFGWTHRRRTITAGGSRTAFVRVAAAELTVMAATVALAVGLSRTPTPVGPDPDLSAATELLGFPLPPGPTVGRWLLTWTPSGFALALVGFAASLYVAGLVVLRRRGEVWPVGRSVAWFLALTVVVEATCGGLGTYSRVLLSAQVVAQLTLLVVAPLGLVAGAPGELLRRTLPEARQDSAQSPARLRRDLLASASMRRLARPQVALGCWALGLLGLYLTGLLGHLMSDHLGPALMASGLLGLGCWLYASSTPLPGRSRAAVLGVAVGVLLLLGIVLLLRHGDLAHDYFTVLRRPYSPHLLADQRRAGRLVLVLAGVPLAALLLGRGGARLPGQESNLRR